MANFNLVEALLAKDAASLLEKETTTYTVKSLSKKLGQEVVITLQALTAQDFMRLRKVSSTRNKKNELELDETRFSANVLLEGIKDPDLHNSALAKHYGAATPAELVLKMFTIGEISDIVETINDLSGNDRDEEETEEEIKN